jgi:hypothetical protein
MAYHGSDGPDYTNAVRLEVAIKDFPRVHAHLSKKLETAEEALADENLSRSSTSAHEQRGPPEGLRRVSACEVQGCL